MHYFVLQMDKINGAVHTLSLMLIVGTFLWCSLMHTAFQPSERQRERWVRYQLYLLIVGLVLFVIWALLPTSATALQLFYGDFL